MTVSLTSDQAINTLSDSDILNAILQVGRVGYCFHANDGTVIKDVGGHLGDHFTEKQQATIRKNGFYDIIDPEDKEMVQRAWEDGIKSRKSFSLTTRINSDKSGTRWHRVNIFPLSDGFVSFFEDISEQKKREQEAAEAQQKAKTALRSKNFLLGRLSHEIRTPMNAVIGIADALMYYDVDPTLTPKLELIQSSADNILRILDRTLNHAKLDAEKLKIEKNPGNPGELVEKLCTLWKAQAEKNGNKIYCVIDKSVPESVPFDRYRYEQCINNLLSNAVKFTQDGIVKVLLTVVEKDGDQNLLLAVQDSGIGMTKTQMSRVFRAFEQADDTITNRFGGTGLGMNITKQIIELMGGSITVKSEIGKGSIFAIRLPIDDADQDVGGMDEKLTNTDMSVENKSDASVLQTTEDKKNPGLASSTETLIRPTIVEDNTPEPVLPAAPIDDSPYSRLKILVADDNPTNHVVINSLLEDVVYEIYTATNGQEVLDILEVEDIDIVLMDIHMPVMDGIESTLAIRSSDKHWSDVLIIALTADPQYQQKRLCLNIGMNDALGKPVKMGEILKSFDRVLNAKENIGILEQAV